MFRSGSIAILQIKTIVIAIAVFIVILFPFTIVGFSYFQGQALEYSQNTAQIINSGIDSYFSGINLSVSNYLSARDISLALRLNNKDTNRLDGEQVSQISTQISSMFMDQPGIEYIILNLEGPVSVHSSASIVNNNFVTHDDPIFNSLLESPHNSITVFMNDRQYYQDAGKRYISTISKIPDYSDWNETVGFFVVDITLDMFVNIASSTIDSDYEYFIETPEGEILYQNIAEDLNNVDKTKYASHTSHNTGLTVYTVQLFPDWQSELLRLAALIIFTSIAYLSLVLIWCYVQSKKIAAPISELEKTMKSLKNNQYHLPTRYNGRIAEISSIYRSMNELVESLSISIEDNYRKDLLLTKSKIRYLNEKIQPHFLYNTLEIISNSAILDGSQSTARMCQMLGKMFRYSLHGSDKVSLEQELDNIDNYIMLKSLSFGYDNFSYKPEIDDEIIGCAFPKMSLQPLIENCFKHGYTHTNEKFIIALKISRYDKDKIRIIISDNGEGMTQEELSNLREHLIDADTNYNYDYSNGGFGLTHSISLMRMFFVKHFDVDINSVQNENTEIVITFIPE